MDSPHRHLDLVHAQVGPPPLQVVLLDDVQPTHGRACPVQLAVAEALSSGREAHRRRRKTTSARARHDRLHLERAVRLGQDLGLDKGLEVSESVAFDLANH